MENLLKYESGSIGKVETNLLPIKVERDKNILHIILFVSRISNLSSYPPSPIQMNILLEKESLENGVNGFYVQLEKTQCQNANINNSKNLPVNVSCVNNYGRPDNHTINFVNTTLSFTVHVFYSF